MEFLQSAAISAELWQASLPELSQVSVYQQWGFSEAIAAAYGYQPQRFALRQANASRYSAVVTLFRFGQTWVSLPFCDCGGIAAVDAAAAAQLLDALRQHLNGQPLILRQMHQLSPQPDALHLQQQKVRMVLALQSDADAQMQAFKAKLRSQIRKPEKEQFYCKQGGVELLADFWQVFTYNMRELGSPVHSKALFVALLQQPDLRSQMFVVYSPEHQPVACGFVMGHGEMLVNPWASSDRRFQKHAPNMLLYWQMLQYAIANGYQQFDFGRSTPGEGTYNFKSQWGAEPEPLHWYSSEADAGTIADSRLKQLVIQIWQRLPLPLVNRLGPVLRKRIHL